MNNNKYPHLTSPIQLGKVTFRNRIFSAPMGATDITADCCPGPRTQGFYELRAKGGAAAVTVSELIPLPIFKLFGVCSLMFIFYFGYKGNDYFSIMLHLQQKLSKPFAVLESYRKR